MGYPAPMRWRDLLELYVLALLWGSVSFRAGAEPARVARGGLPGRRVLELRFPAVLPAGAKRRRRACDLGHLPEPAGGDGRRVALTRGPRGQAGRSERRVDKQPRHRALTATATAGRQKRPWTKLGHRSAACGHDARTRPCGTGAAAAVPTRHVCLGTAMLQASGVQGAAPGTPCRLRFSGMSERLRSGRRRAGDPRPSLD